MDWTLIIIRLMSAVFGGGIWEVVKARESKKN